MSRIPATVLLAVIALVGVSQTALAERILHKEKSLYRNIVVKQEGNRRCLAFSIKRRHHHQTCMNMAKPDQVVFPYVRMSFAGLLLNPRPKTVLMIGLGGGTISRVLSQVYPDLDIDVVEIDEAVAKVARDYFEFNETERIKLHVVDGRVFTRRAQRRDKRYDLIILDAYTGEYIPEHLMTREFLGEVKSLLTEDGVVVANTFGSSRLYDHESVTYDAVFGEFLNFKMSGTGNRVILASATGIPDQETLQNRARLLAPMFEEFAVDLVKYTAYLDRGRDWDTTRRPLTDQFAPANLLRER